jgi:hypothetical protein
MKVNAALAVGVCTKLNLLLKLPLKMTMVIRLTSKPRPVLSVIHLVRDVPAPPRTNAKVAQKASNSELANVLQVEDVSLVRSEWSQPIPSVLRTMELHAMSAKTVLTLTATDVKVTQPVLVNSARKATPDPLVVAAQNVLQDVLSARTLLLV